MIKSSRLRYKLGKKLIERGGEMRAPLKDVFRYFGLRIGTPRTRREAYGGGVKIGRAGAGAGFSIISGEITLCPGISELPKLVAQMRKEAAEKEKELQKLQSTKAIGRLREQQMRRLDADILRAQINRLRKKAAEKEDIYNIFAGHEKEHRKDAIRFGLTSPMKYLVDKTGHTIAVEMSAWYPILRRGGRTAELRDFMIKELEWVEILTEEMPQKERDRVLRRLDQKIAEVAQMERRGAAIPEIKKALHKRFM